VTLQGIYDDNVNLQHDDRQSDFYFSIDPAVVLGFGDLAGRTENFLRFEYAPRVEIYTKYSGNDAFQQIARLEAQHQINRLTLNFTGEMQLLNGNYYQVYSKTGTVSDQVNVDVTQRTRFDLFNFTAGASYDLSSKTFVSAGASYGIANYNNLISSQTIAANAFLNYRYSSKLILGVGGAVGRNVVDDPDPDQTTEQGGGRITYQATGKLSFTAEAAAEFRQVDNGNSDSYVTPVFRLGALYEPFDGTKLSLTASRQTLNSASIAGADYNTTSISADLRQRLLRRFTVGLSFAYQNLDYFSTTDFATIGRQDDYYSVSPSVDVAVTRFWTVGGFYNHRQNSSALGEFSFSDNQVGIRSSLTF
jgi:hypothetical protein